MALPLFVAAATVPSLIDRVGAERFGLLALVWGLIGYAGVLDLGVSRALTQRIASLLVQGEKVEILRVFRSASTVTQVAGGFACVLLLAGAVFSVYERIPIVDVTETELVRAMVLVAIALPIQAISATYRGVNEAYGNFVGISVLRIGLGVANFGLPYLVSFLSNDLSHLVATVVASRALALFFYRHLALGCLAFGRTDSHVATDWNTVVSLMRFGGWYSVSTTLSPLLGQADRFFIAALVSAAAVTSYVIPFEMVTQSLIVVGAVTTVLFPAMSRAVAENATAARHLLRAWCWRVGLVMLILLTALALVMPAVLEVWLQDRVSEQSAMVGRILCLGVLSNSIGAVLFAYLHAHGKVRQTAIAHLVETPIFVGVLYFSVIEFGIIGAASAWVFRMLLDTSILLWFVRSLHREAVQS